MSDQTNNSNEAPQAAQAGSASAAPVKKSSRRKWLIGGLVAVTGLGALAATGAIGAGGWHGHHRGHGWNRTMDPAMMGKKVDFGVDLILGRVGADEAQKTKVATTIKGILGQAPEFRKGRMEAREELIKLLKADKYDKDAVEKLRAAQIKAIDEASKKVAAALGEVAETLTDKQRKELVEFAEKRRAMFKGHRGGRGRH